VSVVVPVYQGEATLEPLLAELEPRTRPTATPGGRLCQVTDVVLVHDGALDRSDATIERLAARYPFVVPVWLSRNFGQHAATLAGMASTSGEWVATLDEDGLHDPADIGRLLDRALETGVPLVYAAPVNEPPHGRLRNALSRLAKRTCAAIVGNPQLRLLGSFRLIDGEIARSLAAYCGPEVYLDVALSWVVSRIETCPVTLRVGASRPSGYTSRALLAHFWRMVLTSGTRPLRVVGALGCLAVLLALATAAWALWQKLTYQVPVQGWTSLVVVIAFFAGATLFALAVIAEYLGLTLSMAMGKPPYLIVSRPAARPARRDRP
jgi:undecaprenyl-phosphate 4-deoxy-4-formamido-L-arabinose transferase